jgi:integrase
VTREDLEKLVESLDARVRGAELSWKTASHAWGLVTRMFADACAAKQRDLRVRSDNPALGIHGPDRGVRKSKVYLWPSEFLRLVSCVDVPLVWRRTFTVATYLYVRAGEGNALDWSDVDLDRRVVHIHRSVDRDTGDMKPTKTSVARRVPIEPELVPLLQVMRKETDGKGRVLAIDSTDRKLSRQLQRCLKLTDVTRADLTTSDATRKAMTFHDLRATGITWCAVRGDDPLKIKQRAGHSTFSTTEGYIREAENLREGFGAVFPPLPASLLKSVGPTGQGLGQEARLYGDLSREMVEAPGIEPGSENGLPAHLRT